MSFVKDCLNNNGQIKPLIINSNDTEGSGLCNPSVFVYENKIYLNLRNVKYLLYHTELNNIEHPWGKLCYFHPENDMTLKTINFICELDSDLNIIKHTKVNTDLLDVPPLWTFIGLEDARLVNWNNNFYLCGVRRDTTQNGVGRMELSLIDFEDNCKELKRYRIEPPIDKNSYCEKNWMPIIDKPFHFIKWSNPTEVVKVNLNDNSSEQVCLINQNLNLNSDMRGGSHIVPYKEGYLGIIHHAYLWFDERNKKDSKYTHRIIYWNKNWNIIKMSKEFNFMSAHIEFVCGMAKYNDDYLITFGFQDNAAFILKAPENVIEDYLNDR